jgi:phosphoribosylglycinamide formyltransferase 2
VTLISQELSEFALHARAILGLPIPEIKLYSPAASKALLVKGFSQKVAFSGLDKALAIPGTGIRLFGKPGVNGERRMGVVLATGNSVENALEKAMVATSCIKAEL